MKTKRMSRLGLELRTKIIFLRSSNGNHPLHSTQIPFSNTKSGVYFLYDSGTV